MANATKNKSAGSKTGTARKTTAAKKTTTKKKTTTSGKRRGRPPKKQPSDGIRVEIVLLTVLAVSILLMLSNFGVGGIVGNAVSDFFFGLFGISAWIFPILLFALTAFYIANKKNSLVIWKLSGCIACFLLFCAFMQLLTSGYSDTTRVLDYYTDSVYDHLGGGLFGGILVRIFGAAFGAIGAYVIVIIGIIISAIIMTQRPVLRNLHEGSSRVWNSAKEQRRQAVQRKQEDHKKRAARVAEEDLSEEDEEPVSSFSKQNASKKKRAFFDFNLKEEEKTHQMALPELSIHRASEEEAADSAETAAAEEPENIPAPSSRG